MRSSRSIGWARRHGGPNKQTCRSGPPGRPVVDACQRAAHQDSAVAVREAVGDAERLDALLVGQERHRPGPVRAPQAAIQPEGVEDAPEGSQMSRYGKGSCDRVPAPVIFIAMFGW